MKNDLFEPRFVITGLIYSLVFSSLYVILSKEKWFDSGLMLVLGFALVIAKLDCIKYFIEEHSLISKKEEVSK